MRMRRHGGICEGMKDNRRSRMAKELGIIGIWIVIYGLVSIASMSLSDVIGVPNSIAAASYAVLCAVIIFFLKNKHKLAYYGFGSLKKLNAGRLLYFIPFVIVASVNLWSGIHIHDTPLQIVLITICMICVAFIEEVIFRSFLFKALQKKSLALAIALPSALFGVIHMLNLLTGADLVSTIFQSFYGAAFGFMCVVFFYKTNRILPCIICHAAGNVFSMFLPEHVSIVMQTIGCVVIVVVSVSYGIYLLIGDKRKKQAERSGADDGKEAGAEERGSADDGKEVSAEERGSADDGKEVSAEERGSAGDGKKISAEERGSADDGKEAGAEEREEPDYSGIIGKTVKGAVDRPLGTTHPQHPDICYSINYGYVDGVFAGDGAEQDVYVFGTDEPLKRFEGKVIAVYHRLNDVEDKWIVSLSGEDIADETILEKISFQEQFFEGKLYR